MLLPVRPSAAVLFSGMTETAMGLRGSLTRTPSGTTRGASSESTESRIEMYLMILYPL